MRTRTAAAVERFFETALLGLLASGYGALLATGRLPLDLAAPAGLAILLRCAIVTGWIRLPAGKWAYLVPGLICLGWPALAIMLDPRRMDYALSMSFYLFCAVSIVFASSRSECVFLALIALLELAAAAVLSSSPLFFVFLALFAGFSLAALMSAEMLRGMERFETQSVPDGMRLPMRLSVLSAAAAAGILLLAAGFFLIVPRTARGARLLFPHLRYMPGFSGLVDLGRFGEIGKNDRPVLHIQPYSKGLPPDLKWRGAVQTYFDGKRWFNVRERWSDVDPAAGTVSVADALQRSRRDGTRVIYRVDARNADPKVLFVAGIPEFVNVSAESLRVDTEGNLKVEIPSGKPLRYEISAQLAPPLPYPLAERRRYLQLPERLDPRISELAWKWSGTGQPLERARRIEGHLQHDFEYELRLPQRPPGDPLADFLFVRKKGHCEYFASSMAVMLRTAGIPSRLVTGFQSGYFNSVSGLYVVRGSDAHAWVEGYIDGLGWMTFDPTPAARNPEQRAGLGRQLEMYLDFLDNGWQDWVMGYDLGRQVTLTTRAESFFERVAKSWQSLRSTPGNFLLLVREWGGWVVGWILLFVAGFFAVPRLRRWCLEFLRRRSLLRVKSRPSGYRDASLLYSRMLDLLSKRGFEKPAWFTAAEFARHLPVEEAARVREFTRVYEQIRFGQDSGAIVELTRLLGEFEIAGTPIPGGR